MTHSPAALGALEKWRRRWPEWAIGAVFVPRTQRDVAFAWLALLQEFTDAAWSGADPTPGLAKLAWWNEELLGWSRGARRHPLGELLLPHNGDWTALARGLRPLQALRGQRPGEQSADLRAAAEAIAACESTLLIGVPGTAQQIQCVAVDLLCEHTLAHSGDGVPSVLRGYSSSSGQGGRVRRLQSTFLRARLRASHGGATRSPHALGTLFSAWRAARGGS